MLPNCFCPNCRRNMKAYSWLKASPTCNHFHNKDVNYQCDLLCCFPEPPISVLTVCIFAQIDNHCTSRFRKRKLNFVKHFAFRFVKKKFEELYFQSTTPDRVDRVFKIYRTTALDQKLVKKTFKLVDETLRRRNLFEAGLL